MSAYSPTTGDLCDYCAAGFLLPSGVCDHCNQSPSQDIDRDWLMAVGFLPDGHPDNGDMAIRLWDITETESDGREPAMQVSYSLRDGSLWLETYGSGGESLCLVELRPRKTRGELRQLCRELGLDLAIRRTDEKAD